VFVDLLRFVAALQMLQGHTIAALLAPEFRHGAVYALWSTARGLTSVAFLFAAGLSFYLATERSSTAANAGRRRRLRAARLVGLGYLLHLPVGLLSSNPATQTRALDELAAVDVLQCIGMSMLLLEALRALVSSPRARVGAALAIAVGLFALAPFANQLSAIGPLRPLLAYLSPTSGSLFPLTPWAAHVFAGFACGAAVRMGASPAGSRVLGIPRSLRIPRSLGVRLAVIVALASVLALTLVACGAPRVLTDHASRHAGVLAVCWSLWLAGERLKAVPSLVATLAQHTLVLYVFHVLLVYGQGVGLAAWIGPRLGPGWAVIAAVFVVVASAAVALGYDRLARARRTG
jgi:uncharacterized membrane protein